MCEVWNFGFDVNCSCELDGGLVAAKTCMNNSDCPPVSGQRYCNGSRVCGTVTSYRCENPGTNYSQCVASGGGLGCTNCPSGCSNGACVNQTRCNDSDNGLNYYVRGLVIPRAGDEQVWDSCKTDFILLEGTCDEQGGKVYEYACPDGCSNGACMSTPIGTCSRNQSGQMRCRYYGSSKGGPAIWTQRCIVRGRNSQGAWTNIAACPYGCAGGVCTSVGSGGGGGSGAYTTGYLRSSGFWGSIFGWFKNLFS